MAWVSAFYAFEGTLEETSAASGRDGGIACLVMYPLFLDFLVDRNHELVGRNN